jgi:hypothetical protein
MKNLLLASSIALAALHASLSTTVAQTKVLIDFGNNTTYRGVTTPGNWNSVAYGYVPNLVDTTGSATALAWAPDALGGVDSYNSIVGPTSDPVTAEEVAATDAAIDKTALGDLGAAQAAIDYYVSNNGATSSGRFQLQGLAVGTKYRLTFYGTKQYVPAGDEETRYEVFADSEYSISLGSGVLTTGSVDGTGNPGSTVSVDVTPALPVVYVQWTGVGNPSAGYINSMSVEAVPFTPAPGTAVLIDFGNDSSFRGVSQTDADSNGNFWNSVWNGAFYPGLVDSTGAATTINFGFTAAAGTDSYNGPAGPTSDPVTPAEIDAVQIDSYLLGPLGGSKRGAIDFYVDSTFQIQGLDPNKTYQLAFFGSRKFPAGNSTTRYTTYTDNTFTEPAASVDLVVGVFGVQNQGQVAVLEDVSPQPDGIIYVGFTGADDAGSGYLNAMMVVEIASSGNAFAEWSGGLAPTPELVSLYAFGGASSPTATDGNLPRSVLTPTHLEMSVIVRTSDPTLVITGETTDNLATGPWLPGGVSYLVDPDQTGVPAGCERRIYQVARETDVRKFLRLTAVLPPQT